MGGATDRIYAINPNHMKVNYPSHIAGSETPGSVHGAWSELSVQHMNARIRIGEICRDIADAMPPGSGDVDTLPYSKVAALDRKFEQLVADWSLQEPPFSSSSDPAARRIALQRSVGILSVHARRARLLRPLLQIDDVAEKFEPFRRQCLTSARAVIEIASSALSETVDTPGLQSGDNGVPGPKSPYVNGIVITHVRHQVAHFSQAFHLVFVHARVSLSRNVYSPRLLQPSL